MKNFSSYFETGTGLCRPRVFVVMGLAVLCFAAAGFGLSRMIGAAFVAPTERVSMAIGVHYFYPFAIGVAGYLLLQVVTQAMGRARYGMAERLRHVLADGFFLALFAAVIYVHFHIKMWIPLINPHTYDAVLYAADGYFSGLLDALGRFRAAIAEAAPSADYFYQGGFLAMFALSLWGHAIGDRRWHFHSMCALLLLEMIGAFTYLIMPAVGPFIYENGGNAAATEAQQGMLAAFRMVQKDGTSWLVEHGGDYFTGPPAAMPSLHIAGAMIMAWYVVAARSPLAPVMVVLSLWIAVESVASRWHYLADLPPGLALGGLAIVLANVICAEPSARETKNKSP